MDTHANTVALVTGGGTGICRGIALALDSLDAVIGRDHDLRGVRALGQYVVHRELEVLRVDLGSVSGQVEYAEFSCT